MLETKTLSAAPSPVKLLIGYSCVVLLLGVIFATLFGDFVAWAIYGTRFILSRRFHNLLSYSQGAFVMLLFSYINQAKKDWKEKKFHLIFIGFVILGAGAIPLASLTARMVILVTTVGLTAFNRPLIPNLALLLVMALACKTITLWSILRTFLSAFETQDQRRIVISE